MPTTKEAPKVEAAKEPYYVVRYTPDTPYRFREHAQTGNGRRFPTFDEADDFRREQQHSEYLEVQKRKDKVRKVRGRRRVVAFWG